MRYLIFGGANIDINAKVLNKINLRDSNVGKMNFSYGGVGRNITENLSRLVNDVYFISVFSNDAISKTMYNQLLDLGVNLNYSIFVDDSPSCYLNLMDDNNDLYLGISSMESINKMDLKMIKDIPINEDDIIIFEANLKEEIIDYLCSLNNYKVVDTISCTKALKIKNYLKNISLLKTNVLEAQAILGEYEPFFMANLFYNFGIKEVLISNGKDGLVYRGKEGLFYIRHKIVTPKSSNGAGDALLSGYVSAIQKGFDEKIKVGIASSLITLDSDFACSNELSMSKIKEVLDDDINLLIQKIN